MKTLILYFKYKLISIRLFIAGTHFVSEKGKYDVKPHINFTIGTLMSLREIDLQAETYYDCENGVYGLFTQYDIDFKHYKLSLQFCT